MSPRRPRNAGPGRALLRIVTLSRVDWAVLVGSLLLLPLVSAGLRLVGLRRVLALIAAIPRPVQGAAEDNLRGATRVASLVEVAARGVWPRPTCLAKAIVASSLLRWRGRAAQLVVGVTKARGPLEAHAWVELDGAALGAPPGGASYAVLARIADRLPSRARIGRHGHAP